MIDLHLSAFAPRWRFLYADRFDAYAKTLENTGLCASISKTLAGQVQKIANDNDTSFNNVVISMIEHCLKENDE